MEQRVYRILITGRNSYIGNAFYEYVQQFDGCYVAERISLRADAWRSMDWSVYDCVFHVAGIAHADVGKVGVEQQRLYYAVNRDLTREVAEKAKREGVRQFIYMSSAIVYGASAPIGVPRVITGDMIPEPENFYGDSKLQAEQAILPLEEENFRVVVLRPPMIYGRGSRGNYPILSKFARKLVLFPKVQNQRSMLYVENLCEFVRLMIIHGERGIFHPQNASYVNTSELVQMIARAHGRHLILVPGVTWALKLLGHMTGLVNKAFGNLCYDQRLSAYPEEYRIADLEESVRRTEV